MTLFILALGVIAVFLPFVPTWIEIVRKTDATPLKISTQILKDPRETPIAVFWHLVQLLGLDSLDDLKKKATVKQPLMLKESLMAVPAGILFEGIPKNVARVIAAESIELPSRVAYSCKILSLGSILTGDHSLFNELHADEQLTVSTGSKVVWWATANTITLNPEVKTPGKVQAKTSIRINGPVYFHALEAPLIQNTSHPVIIQEKRTLNPTRERILSANDFEVPADEIIEADLVIKGKLLIGPGARIFGSIKAHQGITLGSGAHVYGDVIGLKDIVFSGSNFIQGTLLGNQKIHFGPKCIFGLPESPSTCSAKELSIEGQFQAHGMVRAWKIGHFS